MNCYFPWFVIFPSAGGEGLCSLILNGPYPPGPLPLTTYFTALALTLLVEGAIVCAVLRRCDRKVLAAVLVANLLTHPATVYLWIPFATHRDFTTREILLYAELTIPFIEAAVYRAVELRATGLSVVANFASWTVGALL